MRTQRSAAIVAAVALLALVAGSGSLSAQQSVKDPDPATMQGMYGEGIDFDTFLSNATGRRELWNSNFGKADPAADFVARAEALDGGYQLLVVASLMPT